MQRRSKSYVVTLIGGVPFSADKALALVADPAQHLNFVHGMNVFVLYFHSRMRLSNISKTFITVLHNEVDLVFVSRLDRHIFHYIAPKVRMELGRLHEKDNLVLYDDLDLLKDVITAHTQLTRNNLNAQQHRFNSPPNQPPQEDTPVSDQEIMRQLIDKMKSVGYSGLSPAELDFLKTYSDKLNKDKQKGQENVD